MAEEESGAVLDAVSKNIFVESSSHSTEFKTEVKGYTFTRPDESGGAVDYHDLLQSFRTTGFQATNFGLAVEEISKMVRQWCYVEGIRLQPHPVFPLDQLQLLCITLESATELSTCRLKHLILSAIRAYSAERDPFTGAKLKLVP